MPIIIPAELNRVLDRELRTGDLQTRLLQRQACAEREAKQIARNNPRLRSMEGVGRLRMSIPADAFHFWGQKLGYDCWQSKEFLREFERDNPGLKRNSGGTKMQHGFGQQLALRDGPVRPAKFKRVYA